MVDTKISAGYRLALVVAVASERIEQPRVVSRRMTALFAISALFAFDVEHGNRHAKLANLVRRRIQFGFE